MEHCIERPQPWPTKSLNKPACSFEDVERPQRQTRKRLSANHQGAKYPGEPIKTLAAMVFQVIQQNGIFFVYM